MKNVHVRCRRWWCTFTHLIRIFHDTLHLSIVTLLRGDTSRYPPKKESSKTERKDTCRLRKQILFKKIQSSSLHPLDWAGRVFLFMLSCFVQQVIFTFLTTSINLTNEIDPSNVDPAWIKFSSFLDDLPRRCHLECHFARRFIPGIFPSWHLFFVGFLHSDNRDMSPYFPECQVLVAVNRFREVRQLLRKMPRTRRWTNWIGRRSICFSSHVGSLAVVYQASRLTFPKSSGRTWLVLTWLHCTLLWRNVLFLDCSVQHKHRMHLMNFDCDRLQFILQVRLKSCAAFSILISVRTQSASLQRLPNYGLDSLLSQRTLNRVFCWSSARSLRMICSSWFRIKVSLTFVLKDRSKCPESFVNF